MGISRGFIILFAVITCSLFNLLSVSAGEVTLKEVLSYQDTNQDQNSLVTSKASENLYRNLPAFSPWLTDVQTSVINQLNIFESFPGLPVTRGAESTPLRGRITQNTPYGLNLELQFEEQLGSPDLSGSFTDHYFKGTLSFSLVNDFLGNNSRILGSSHKNLKEQIESNQKVLQCLDISKQYIQTFSTRKKLEVSTKNLSELKDLYRKVSKAARVGAISRDDQTSMRVDINNLETQIMTTSAQLTDLSLNLQNTSGFDFSERELSQPDHLNISEDKLKKNNYSSLKHIELLSEELKMIEKQLKFVEIQDGKDINLIAGIEELDRRQSVANLSVETSNKFVGIQASWRFGDNSNKNQVKRLKALINLKSIELNNKKTSDILKTKTYLKEISLLTAKIKALKEIGAKSSRLERNLLNKFKNGNVRYFEFLSARNQVVQLENSLIDTNALYWTRNADLMFLAGNYNQVCGKGL